MADYKLPLAICFPAKSKEEEKKDVEVYQKYAQLVSTLPVSRAWPCTSLHRYEGFWFTSGSGLEGTMAAKEHFTARPGDVLLATLPKVGTTWLKALAFAVANRAPGSPYPLTALLTNSPHECVPFVELQMYDGKRMPDLDVLPSPRLLSTHMPYSLLPQSVVDPSGGAKIVYLCRNPRDTFISTWQFVNKLVPWFLSVKLERALDCFLNGVHWDGPFWDHVKGFWEASQSNPETVLFMNYEELQRDPAAELRKLAAFMDQPFTAEEEADGMVERIVEMCSMKNLSNLHVNRKGVTDMSQMGFNNKTFFRKGVVGDWANHLTPEMTERLDRVVEEKLQGSGLSFKGCYESVDNKL